jgi:hypothetical protein
VLNKTLAAQSGNLRIGESAELIRTKTGAAAGNGTGFTRFLSLTADRLSDLGDPFG